MKKCTGKGIIQTGFETCSEEKFTWIKRKSALQSAVLQEHLFDDIQITSLIYEEQQADGETGSSD